MAAVEKPRRPAARLGLRQLRGWRPGAGQLGLLVATLLLQWAALGVTIALFPGVSADSAWNVLFAAMLLGLISAPLRTASAAFAGLLGWGGVVVGWLLIQSALVYAALSVTPGIHVSGFWPVFWASWIYAALASIGLWFVTAGDNMAVLGHLLHGTRRARTGTATDVPGVVMIQIDGLSAPLVRWAVRAGNLPTLSRWIRTGGHTLSDWHVRLPTTTPASQAGILHGTSDHIPAFRWYEKETGRLVVTNHPKDSAFVEERMSNGRGLLAQGGVSLSNVFSGDAPTSLLTMSTAGDRKRRAGPTSGIRAYLIHPYGLTRSIVLTIGEMLKELYQSRRQRARGIEPRIHRAGSYVALRGVTNVLLRDVNLTLIAEQMMRGAPVIYCDFVDYDEIAHHAGPTRPESLAALEGIDRVLGTLEAVAAASARPYRFVVLSDHGQSQGATFKQRYGMTHEDLVHDLMSGRPATAESGEDHEDEQWGRVGMFLTELGDESRMADRLGRRAQRDRPQPALPSGIEERPELLVVASGNLGMVYFPRHLARLTVEEIEELYPRLLTGLAGHPGIAFAMAMSQAGSPIVLGGDGILHLADGRVEGRDPLVGFGSYAASDLRRHSGLANVGDIVLGSRLDEGTDEVAAFEELVGCHGGMGGWQTDAVLVHPADWPLHGELNGADEVHHQLILWLEKAGLRLPDSPLPPAPP
jgi:hypothetical protein